MAEYSMHNFTYGGNTYNLEAIWYGVCSSTAATVAKVVTITGFPSTLVAGTAVAINFTYSNTAASPTLNVNSTGAKAIKRYGTTAPSSTVATSWAAGATVLMIYDGSYWRICTHNDNTTYSAISVSNIQNTAGTTTGLITGSRFKSGFDANTEAGAAATTNYTTANVKNIIESTSAPGTTSAPTGTVWLQYGATPPSDRADYVIEQGTSGIWTYRKWNSGIAECWGTSEVSNLAITTTWGSLKYGTLSAINFPSNLFNAAPNLTIFLRSTAGRVWATQTTNLSSSTTGTIYAIAPGEYAAGSTTIMVVMTAIGTWK